MKLFFKLLFFIGISVQQNVLLSNESAAKKPLIEKDQKQKDIDYEMQAVMHLQKALKTGKDRRANLVQALHAMQKIDGTAPWVYLAQQSSEKEIKKPWYKTKGWLNGQQLEKYKTIVALRQCGDFFESLKKSKRPNKSFSVGGLRKYQADKKILGDTKDWGSRYKKLDVLHTKFCNLVDEKNRDKVKRLVRKSYPYLVEKKKESKKN